MKLRIASDLHLEINRQAKVPVPEFIQGVAGERMIFPGDTLAAHYIRPESNDATGRSIKGHFEKLLMQCKGFDKVYFLMGNHEHYRGHYQSTKFIMEKFMYKECGLSKDQFVVLDNGLDFLDKDTILVGTTLWTDFRKENPSAMWNVGRGMNDFRLITYGDSFDIFQPEHALAEHKQMLAYLKAVVAEHPRKRIIVATHHAPSYQSNGRDYSYSEIIDGYCSDLEDFILENGNITDWIHGHTHVNVDYHIGGCHVTSNMRGYVGHDASAKTFSKEQYDERVIEV